MSKTNKLKLAQWAVDYTVKTGANEASVSLTNQRDIEIAYRDGKLETLKESTKNSLSLSIYVENRYSNHTTNDLGEKSLETFIKEAVAATKYLSKDKYRRLPDAKYYPGADRREFEMVDGSYENVKSEKRVEITQAIQEAASKVSDKIISAKSEYGDSYGEVIRVNSNGFSGISKGTVFWAGASVTVKDGEKGRPSGSYWAGGRYLNDIPKTTLLGEEAANRALRKIGQKKIKSGKYTMIVENRAARRLLSIFSGAMRARSLQQKSSFLEGMLGKKVASDKLTIIDDPFLEKGISSRYFDSEGIVAVKRPMIEKGILKDFYVDYYYGQKLGMEPTTRSPSNLTFGLGDRNLDAIVKSTNKGILITGFIGGNSNSTTGDFSFGIVGLLVENGIITQPINEMNITGNAKEFWNQLAEVGNDAYPYFSQKPPTMVFDDINFSGL